MRFLYGLSTSLAENYEKAAIETIEFAKNNSFDVVEIFCETPDVLPNKMDLEAIKKIKDLSSKYGIRIQVHAPFHSLNLASFNPSIRDVSIKIIKSTIDFAEKLEAKLLTFHLGLCFLPCQLDREEALGILVGSLNEIIDYVEQYDLILAMENRGGRLDLGRLEDLLKILEEIQHEQLRVTFDVVQANAVGDPLEYYENLKDKIVNIHVSDSPKGRSLLLAVGEGEIDYKELVRRFMRDNLNVPLIFEVADKEKAIKSREVLDKYLLELSRELP